MKKLLGIVVLGFLLSGNAYAERITCKDTETNKKFTVIYNSQEIKAFGKTFEDVYVDGNSILANYTKWKGQRIVEYWTFFLSFDGLSRLSKGKYVSGEYKSLSRKYYNCN